MHAVDHYAHAPRRRRIMLAAVVLLYLLAPLVALRLRGPAPIDLAWDACMGAGLAATGALALLPLLSARWWAAQTRDADRLRLVQVLHRQISYLLCALVFAHLLGLVLLESRVIDYLLPTAPAYMLAGLIALLLIVVLIATSLGRARLHWANPGWRRWHAALSAAAAGLTGWHLWGSAYWVATPVALGVAAWLLGLPTLLTLAWHRWPPTRLPVKAGTASGGRSIVGSALAWTLFTLVLIAIAAFAWHPPADPARAPHPFPCPQGRCL